MGHCCLINQGRRGFCRDVSLTFAARTFIITSLFFHVSTELAGCVGQSVVHKLQAVDSSDPLKKTSLPLTQ